MYNSFGRSFFILICLFGLFASKLAAQKSDNVERLEKLLKLSKNDTNTIAVLNALFKEYESSLPLKAKTYAEEALKLSEKIKYRNGLILSCENIASIYHSQGVYPKAIEFYQRALSLKAPNDDKKSIAESNNKIGNALVQLNEVEKGINHYKKALLIEQSLNDLSGLAVVYTNIGGAYYKLKDYNVSIEFHLRALALADSINNREVIAYNLNRLGETYFRKENYKEALSIYKQLLFLAQKSANKLDLQRAYQGLSQIYASTGDFKKAYDNFKLYSVTKDAYFKDLQTQAKKDITETRTELDEAKRIQQLKDAENARKNTLIYAILSGAALLLVIIFILFRNNRQRMKTNQLLTKQKEEIEQQSNELLKQKNKIEQQNESINRKNETLEATFKEIERKNKDITASINYAKRIQESMLPSQALLKKNLPEHFIFFKPRDIVSGDFYWLAEKNGKIILAVMDCTGHGVPGAIMSMLGDSYLNQVVSLQNIIRPDEILSELHKSIGVALQQDETRNQDGMDIALCVIDHENKKLEFAGASRIMYIIQNGTAQSVESCKLPVGGFQREREREFILHEFSIDLPTYFYIFSDGFQDQFGGPRGRKFAKSRLEETLFENHLKPMEEQKEILDQTLTDWMGDNRQMDDILLIGVKL